MRPRPFHFVPLALLAAASPVYADPLADFVSGGGAFIEMATVDLAHGGRTSTGSKALVKKERSADIVVSATDFGFEFPIALRLRGTTLRDGTIEYRIDETYEPAVALGGNHFLKGVSGRLVMRALHLRGTERPEMGNVRLVLAKAGSLVARTDLGDISLPIDHLSIQGGVIQPPLAALEDATRTTICSARVPTYHAFTVVLADPAKATGAVVHLTAQRDSGVHLPAGVGVRAGSKSATVTARIDPGFVGRVQLTAAAGGIERALEIDVRSFDACGRR